MRHAHRLLVFASLLSLLGAAVAEPASDPFFAASTTVADFGAATRPFGIAAGDFDGDGHPDFVVGRTTGNIAFVHGNGDGTFAAPVAFAWKQAFFNAWAFAAADINNDGRLDVVWGANASSPATSSVVNDGEVRVFFGNGDGTFQQTAYLVSGVLHNAGTLIADVGTDAGSLAVGDIDGDGLVDVVAGAIDGSMSVVKVLRNQGAGTFAVETLIAQPTGTSGDLASPTYFPAISTQNSPWGIALGDADGDGDLDVWLGDRALYVYLYINDGGALTLRTNNTALPTRPNVYLAHDAWRPAVGYTPSLAAGDVNGDGRADLVLGLLSGTQTPASGVAHDGEVLLDVSSGGAHVRLGAIADLGTMTRGVTLVDINHDGALDVVAAEYDGAVKVLRQLPPIDEDTDGVSDYLDNALDIANAPRIDLNSDGTLNHLDQLDNDADTVLGNPEDRSTWQRLGDPADPDDDDDLIADVSDNCAFIGNAGQDDVDLDGVGDVCDPLDGRDLDGDGIPDGPRPGASLFDQSKAAKAKWASGTTRFVIRIDALGRFFQNEFTQIMTDAAVLSPADWAAKCWENYQADDIPGYQPCGTDGNLTLAGGKEVPITLVTIPKQLWTDPPVITWINDRNNNPLFELGQHGAYHADNTMAGDWKGLADRNFFSCEMCGLSEAENFEVLRVGFDTLRGEYGNKSVRESGATDSSPRIDWTSSYWQLVSFAPPFNTSDALGRQATARLGFKAFSASVFEESGSYAQIFSPEGSHHERFDQFGMFHASADLELDPPDTSGDTYDAAAYAQYLQSKTDQGGLTTWLIEEVEWSGRPCPNDNRLGTCSGASNRENNTVYLPRWQAWMQLLDFVKTYPGGVPMTMAEAALAMGFDNAPTVANANQADSDADGVGDAIDGAMLTSLTGSVGRNEPATLVVRLVNGAGTPISGQPITFRFDANGNGEDEAYEGTTGSDGVAEATVLATRPVGSAEFSADWDGILITASMTAGVKVVDGSAVVLDSTNPTAGQATDVVTVGATLTDSDGAALSGRQLTFRIGSASATAVTDAGGHALAALLLPEPAGNLVLEVSFAGDELYGVSSAAAAFVIQREDTAVTVSTVAPEKNNPAIARARLTEADGAGLDGKTLRFDIQTRQRGEIIWVAIGSAVTDASGGASLAIPSRYANQQTPLRVVFDGDAGFLPSLGTGSVVRR